MRLTLIPEWIQACEQVLEKYQASGLYGKHALVVWETHCPLCIVSLEEHALVDKGPHPSMPCICPWNEWESMDCLGRFKKGEALRTRFRRLKRWIKFLEEEKSRVGDK